MRSRRQRAARKTRRRGSQKGGNGGNNTTANNVLVAPVSNFVGTRPVSYLADVPDLLYTLKGRDIPIEKEDIIRPMLESMECTSLDEVKEKVNAAIQSLYAFKPSCDEPDDWVICYGKCESEIARLMKAELSSTAYMLRALAASILSTNATPFTLKAITPTTGLWTNDYKSIVLGTLGKPVPKGRLLMGFGPSAAGKTHWAKTIVKLLSTPEFPDTFVSVDGGIYREASVVYQYMVEGAAAACVKGFDNLVLASYSLYRSSLFQSDAVKKQMMDWLAIQTVPISLYVPDTLGDCGWGPLPACKSKIAKYVKVTGDKEGWIGLLIWQHKTKALCPFKGEQVCVGCKESGGARELAEGKKYSGTMYDHSMSQGDMMMKAAPGGSYKIHNCGRADGISHIEDYTAESANQRAIRTVLEDETNKRDYKYRYFHVHSVV